MYSRKSTLPLVVVEGPLQFGPKSIWPILVPRCLVFLWCSSDWKLGSDSATRASALAGNKCCHMSAANKPMSFIPGFTEIFHGNHWHVDDTRLLGYWPDV